MDAELTLTELFDNNEKLLDLYVGPKQVNQFIGLIKQKGIYLKSYSRIVDLILTTFYIVFNLGMDCMYISFLKALCNCQGKPIRSKQDLLSKM